MVVENVEMTLVLHFDYLFPQEFKKMGRVLNKNESFKASSFTGSFAVRELPDYEWSNYIEYQISAPCVKRIK